METTMQNIGTTSASTTNKKTATLIDNSYMDSLQDALMEYGAMGLTKELSEIYGDLMYAVNLIQSAQQAIEKGDTQEAIAQLECYDPTRLPDLYLPLLSAIRLIESVDCVTGVYKMLRKLDTK